MVRLLELSGNLDRLLTAQGGLQTAPDCLESGYSMAQDRLQTAPGSARAAMVHFRRSTRPTMLQTFQMFQIG